MKMLNSVLATGLCGLALCLASTVSAQQTGGGTGGDADGGTGQQGQGGTGQLQGNIQSPFEQATQEGLQQNLEAASQIFDDTRQQGFVGGPDESATSLFGTIGGEQGGGGRGGLQLFFESLGNLNQGAGNVRTQRRVLRAPLRVAFVVSRPDDQVVAQQFESRLYKLPLFESNPSLDMVLENRTLTLTGIVSTPREREMIERLAMLEPGVSRVENQLSVVGGEN